MTGVKIVLVFILVTAALLGMYLYGRSRRG